jgi:hypothetical protein
MPHESTLGEQDENDDRPSQCDVKHCARAVGKIGEEAKKRWSHQPWQNRRYPQRGPMRRTETSRVVVTPRFIGTWIARYALCRSEERVSGSRACIQKSQLRGQSRPDLPNASLSTDDPKAAILCLQRSTRSQPSYDLTRAVDEELHKWIGRAVLQGNCPDRYASKRQFDRQDRDVRILRGECQS